MTRFGSDPQEFFAAVYREAAPWDIGGPQPAMVELLAEFPPEGPVLDAGCGTGDLAIHLAGLGYQTLGVDFVEDAIAEARRRRDALPPQAAARLEFEVGDALLPGRLGRSFGAVVDSGFYHLFEAEAGEWYAAEVAAVLRPGGRFYLHEFAVTFPVPNMPREVTEAELRDRFSARRGWRILALRPGEFLSRVAPVPAILACVEYVGAPGADRGMDITYLEAPSEPGARLDAGDLVGACLGQGTDRLLADVGALPDAFFDLSSGVAGDLVQKLTNYGIRMAAVVPDPSRHSSAFQDFAREANRAGGLFRFFATRDEALTWLTRP